MVWHTPSPASCHIRKHIKYRYAEEYSYIVTQNSTARGRYIWESPEWSWPWTLWREGEKSERGEPGVWFWEKGLSTYFKYQSRPGLQVLPSIPQFLFGTTCPNPWTFQAKCWASLPREAPPCIIQTFSSLLPSPILFWNKCPFPLSLSLPYPPLFPLGQLPWPHSWGQWTCLLESTIPINLPLIQFNMFWIGTFSWWRNNISDGAEPRRSWTPIQCCWSFLGRVGTIYDPLSFSAGGKRRTWDTGRTCSKEGLSKDASKGLPEKRKWNKFS